MALAVDTVTMERIQIRQREMHPARTALMLVASLLFAIGWAARAVFVVLWVAFSWSASAVAEGWSAAAERQRSGAG